MHSRPISAIIIGMLRLSGPPGRRAERSGLRRATRRLVLAVAAIAAVCLATGCGSAIKNAGGAIKSAASSLAPHHGNSASPASSDTITPTPTDTSTPAPTPTPTVTPTSTVTVTPTVTPSTQISTKLVTPHPKKSATASGSASKYLWLWVLLGVVVLVGLIAWIAAAAHRRRATAANAWRSRAVRRVREGLGPLRRDERGRSAGPADRRRRRCAMVRHPAPRG